MFALAACGRRDDVAPITWPPPAPPAAAEGRCSDQPDSLTELPVWDLYVAQEGWDALHRDVQASLDVQALLCVNGEPFATDLELQGASTRRLRKKSFDLKFPEGRPLDAAPFGEPEQLPRILLKAMLADQSLIREALAFELWRTLGHDAPRVGFANLRINGAYWGLYTVVEPIDEEFLARRDYPAGGRLYKGVRQEGTRADFRPGRDLYKAFESKSKIPPPWEDLEALAEKLQRTALTDAAFGSAIDPIFSLDRYMERMIWISITQNSDAIGQNFYLYNAPQDGRDYWYMLPWDSNLCCGANWSDAYGLIGTDEQPMIDGANFFGNRLVKIKGLRRRYVARFRQVLDEVLTEDVVLSLYRPLAALVEHDLALDQARWKREVSPADAFSALESFFRDRAGFLHAAIDEFEREHGDVVLHEPDLDAGRGVDDEEAEPADAGADETD
jgi:spore coat protein H